MSISFVCSWPQLWLQTIYFMRALNVFGRLIAFFVMALIFWTAGPVFSENNVYETPDAFVSRHFNGTPPKPSMLYPDAILKQKIKDILGHRYSKFRIRYWLKDTRSVWVLEEIGKERPITSGFVVNSGSLEVVKVLIFRESRGWEVRYDSFSNQFTGARLTQLLTLNHNINNITGATLSVRAVTKLARLALLLHTAIT